MLSAVFGDAIGCDPAFAREPIERLDIRQVEEAGPVRRASPQKLRPGPQRLAIGSSPQETTPNFISTKVPDSL
jgi:hypothetical protein